MESTIKQQIFLLTEGSTAVYLNLYRTTTGGIRCKSRDPTSNYGVILDRANQPDTYNYLFANVRDSCMHDLFVAKCPELAASQQ